MMDKVILMKRIFKVIEKYFFIIVILAVIISMIEPKLFNWVLSEVNGINIINLLLGVVLFTMGTTLKVDNFVNVFRNPKAVAVGVSAQYIVMPLIAFVLASLFSLDAGLTVGLILVGTVPGGTASDVITFLAGGDVALSVSMTAVSTVMSPLLTPLITLLLIGNQIHFDPVAMFISVFQIVIIPIATGLLLNYKFPAFCEKLGDYLPGLSSLVVCIIVAGVIGANKQAILTSFGVIMGVIVLQYFISMGLGFVVGHFAGLNKKQMITVAIELAFQNSGLSTSLAKTHFPSLTQATVPGAIYSAWQNLAGSIIAYLYKRYYS